MGLSIFEDLVLIQTAELLLSCHRPLCIEVASRRGSKLGMQRSRDVCHQSLHLTGHIRVLALELLLHVVSRLCDQLLEEMPGDVLTTTELLDENRIALGAFDHVQNTKLRKARAVVCCDRVNHLPIPSSHKHVRYVRANGLSPRYCEQMQLAFGPGISNQGSSIEPLGMTKYGACNIDRIIEG